MSDLRFFSPPTYIQNTLEPDALPILDPSKVTPIPEENREALEDLFSGPTKACKTSAKAKDKDKVLKALATPDGKQIGALSYLLQSKAVVTNTNKKALCEEIYTMLKDPPHPSFTAPETSYDPDKLVEICKNVTKNGPVGEGDNQLSQVICDPPPKDKSLKKLSKAELVRRLSLLIPKSEKEEKKEPDDDIPMVPETQVMEQELEQPLFTIQNITLKSLSASELDKTITYPSNDVKAKENAISEAKRFLDQRNPDAVYLFMDASEADVVNELKTTEEQSEEDRKKIMSQTIERAWDKLKTQEPRENKPFIPIIPKGVKTMMTMEKMIQAKENRTSLTSVPSVIFQNGKYVPFDQNKDEVMKRILTCLRTI